MGVQIDEVRQNAAALVWYLRRPSLHREMLRRLVRNSTGQRKSTSQLRRERDEATPLVILRNTNVTLTDAPISVEDVAIPWQMCIYVESLTVGLLPDGAPTEAYSAKLRNQVTR